MALLSLISTGAHAGSDGSVDLLEGRLKIRFSVPAEKSKGSFQLRAILEKHGFKNDEGFVRTGEALAPLEIYNYLYENGRYVFNVYLPVKDRSLFASFGEHGSLSFGGIAARRLFDVVKLYLPRREDLANLEQYKITEHSYCDRTVAEPAQYRCRIEN